MASIVYSVASLIVLLYLYFRCLRSTDSATPCAILVRNLVQRSRHTTIVGVEDSLRRIDRLVPLLCACPDFWLNRRRTAYGLLAGEADR